MKMTALHKLRRLAFSALLLGSLGASALAYPPALPHTFYGMVRDELGNPLPQGASITLETSSGVKVYGVVSYIFESGVNYRLSIPLDSGLTSEAYRPTALHPSVPFKIKVTIGTTTYLPIEMSRDFKLMGLPGKSTLLNLTLGEDLNGDGLPDAWQRRINADLNATNPGGDFDHDGLSNLDEYLAGTYAYDPSSGFSLKIVRVNEGSPVLSFTAISGRTYTIFGSDSLESTSWSPVQFRLILNNTAGPVLDAFSASDVAAVEVEVVTPPGQAPARFFKVMLQ
ncbi:MAG: hypothetical protein SFY81_02525 [Verrucomicrobiota bacterium]|nr:hypothetical protein [Verrucomicrobiota bacterium]